MKYDIFSVVTAVVGKKNWSGFNQPKLRDLGPLSDKKLELLTTNCDLLNLPKSYGGNGWGIPSIYGDILKAQRAQRTKARLTQAQRPYGPSISVKLEGLGKVPGAEFAGKILQMFGRQFGKFNAHFWGFEYDMM